MALPNDLTEVFQNVVARAKRLKRSSYMQQIISQGGFNLNLSFNAPNKSGSVALDVPGEEPRDALLLTARMFVQENDPVSFRWIADNVLQRPEVSKEWKDAFKFIRSELNAYLDAATGMDFFGKKLKNRDIFFTCLYGHYAHSGDKYINDYKQWTSNPLTKGLVDFNFTSVVVRLVNFIAMLDEICQMEIDGKTIPPPSRDVTPTDSDPSEQGPSSDTPE